MGGERHGGRGCLRACALPACSPHPPTQQPHPRTHPRSAVKKVQPVLGGFDSAKYTTERLWATAPDGVQARGGGGEGAREGCTLLHCACCMSAHPPHPPPPNASTLPRHTRTHAHAHA